LSKDSYQQINLNPYESDFLGSTLNSSIRRRSDCEYLLSVVTNSFSCLRFS